MALARYRTVTVAQALQASGFAAQISGSSVGFFIRRWTSECLRHGGKTPLCKDALYREQITGTISTEFGLCSV